MKKRMILLLVAAVATSFVISCTPMDFPIAYISCDTNASDANGYLTGTTGSPSIVGGGYRGNCCRSSHNDDDHDADDFRKTGPVPTGDFWLGMNLMYENNYVNTSDNVKWLWIQGQNSEKVESGHFELIYGRDTVPNVLNMRVQLNKGGAGFNGGTDIVHYFEVPYVKGQWMSVSVMVKKSTGAGHLNPDGIIQVSVNGNVVFEDRNTITGEMYGNIHIPGMNGTADQAPGAGWWRVDEIRLYNWVPL